MIPIAAVRGKGNTSGAEYAGGLGGCDPSAIICDTFTGTNGTDMSSHSPNIDTEGGGYSGDATSYEIQSNKLICSNGLNDNYLYIDSGVADKVISITCNFTTGSIQLYGRSTSNRSESWSGRVAANGDVILWRDTTQISSDNIGSLTTGTHKVTMEFNGTSIRLLVDDVEALATTSSTYQTNTYVVIRSFGMVTVGDDDMDDLEVIAP